MFGYDVQDVAAVTVEHELGVVGTNLHRVQRRPRSLSRPFEVFFEQGAVELTTNFIVGAPEGVPSSNHQTGHQNGPASFLCRSNIS